MRQIQYARDLREDAGMFTGAVALGNQADLRNALIPVGRFDNTRYGFSRFGHASPCSRIAQVARDIVCDVCGDSPFGFEHKSFMNVDPA
jgi:hypothetical protein